MKLVKKMVITASMVFFVFSIMMINGCGSNKESKNEGCPSGTFVANDTDKLTGPADSSFTVNSSFGAPFLGGTVIVSPLIYTVADSTGTAKNKVCITLYTGGSTGNGFWYSDSNYSTVVNGSGALNRVVAVTDASGRAALYWSSESLPPANPVTSSGTGTAITLTAGADQNGTSWVKADSGILQTIFNFNWTVKGEPAK